MSLNERVYSVLLVSAQDSFNSSLQTLLPDSRFNPLRIEKSITAAKRLILERHFDFVVINSPLPDDTGLRFAIDVCNLKSSVALILVKAEVYSAAYDKVAEHGVFVLSKPTSKPMVLNAVDWMIATHERLKKLEKKSTSMEDKMLEIRIVNRAKWLLIEELKMSESDAHRYIEKQAMDRCVSRKEIAEGIIKAYS